jgi:nicotinate-nucleotide adenylyltransferase
MTSPRTGILGGTFDPIHVGHLALAEAARRALALDRVLLVPAHDPPHKPAQPRASAYHRFAMAALAVAGHDALELSDMELLRLGPSYTAGTLRALLAAGYKTTQLFFITGGDAFADIATWREYPSLLDMAHFVVVTRPGWAARGTPAILPNLASRMHDLQTEPGAGIDTSGQPLILLLDAATPDVSATRIRGQLAEGRSITGLVPPAVERHIHRHHLYASEGSGRSMPHPR